MSDETDAINEEAKGMFDKIPDVWFDWYVRFLPGCFGVALYLYLVSSPPLKTEGGGLIFFAIISYIVGHILQPLSSALVKLIERCWGVESDYAKAKAKAKSENRESLLHKVSKAHAEAASMLSFAIVLCIDATLTWGSSKLSVTYAAIGFFYFLAATIERTYARKRKIKDLP